MWVTHSGSTRDLLCVDKNTLTQLQVQIFLGTIFLLPSIFSMCLLGQRSLLPFHLVVTLWGRSYFTRLCRILKTSCSTRAYTCCIVHAYKFAGDIPKVRNYSHILTALRVWDRECGIKSIPHSACTKALYDTSADWIINVLWFGRAKRYPMAQFVTHEQNYNVPDDCVVMIFEQCLRCPV